MNISINELCIYIIDITLITFVVRGIYNKTAFVDDFTQWLYLKLNKGKQWLYKPMAKPFGCAFCMNFWIVFIYSMFYVNFLYSIAIALFMAKFSDYLINKIK